MPPRRTCRPPSTPPKACCPTACRTRPSTTRSTRPTRPILTLALTSDALPLRQVNDLADTVLAQKLSEVTGVGLVTIEGNQKPAIRVRINPAAIASLGLGLEDIRTALDANNVNQPKGSFDGARQSYAIGANDQIFSAADYGNVIVAYRNGAPVRLARHRRGRRQRRKRPPRRLGRRQARRDVDIQRQPGANIIQTADRVKALLPKLRASLPPSVKIDILTDRTETIRASVSGRAVHAHPDGRSGRHGDLRFPAEILGDGHSQRGPAAGHHRHFRRHGTASASAWTIFRSWP